MRKDYLIPTNSRMDGIDSDIKVGAKPGEWQKFGRGEKWDDMQRKVKLQ